MVPAVAKASARLMDVPASGMTYKHTVVGIGAAPIKSKQKSCPDNTITVGTDTNGRLRCAPFAPPGNGWDEVWKEVERGRDLRLHRLLRPKVGRTMTRL